MKRLLAVGECMIELSGAGDDLWRLGVAGDTLNTAWYARAALPDGWSVDYLTAVGTDPFSDRAVAFLTANHIGTRHIQRHPTRSIGLYAISLTKGERSFSYWRDASAARTLADDPARLAIALAEADVIHLSGITLAILSPEARANLIFQLAAQRQRGALTVLDPNHRPRLWSDDETARSVISAAAKACALILPSFDDEQALFGDGTPEATLARYDALGADTVVVKNGAKGPVARHLGQEIAVSGLPMVTPLDTTGAGDSFNGAFLASFLQGHSCETAMRVGHAMACRVVRHPGALIPMAQLAEPS